MTTNALTTYLEQLELSPLEIKIYLTLLKEGNLSAQTIIKKLQINRTSVYPPLDSLFNKGLITKSIKGKRMEFTINDPQNRLRIALDDHIARKKQALKDLEITFPNIIQQLPLPHPQTQTTDELETRIYKGIHNARKIYEEAFQANEIRSYAKVYKKSEQLFPDNMAIFNQAFATNQKLKMWEIIYDFDSTLKPPQQLTTDTNSRYFYKLMPKNLKLSSEDILIYDGKVAIINYRAGKTSIVLKSSDFYNNLKELFDFIWNVLP